MRLTKQRCHPERVAARILDDQTLVTAVARQEQAAFEDLYDRYHLIVYHLARKILNDTDRAEEVVYDVFW